MTELSKAKVIRLRSHHDKYLVADEDDGVVQDRNGSSKQARWAVEFVGDGSNFLRLKSCYHRYLTASNKPYLLGLTGHKVIQDLPARLGSSVEWEPVEEGMQVKFKTRYGKLLRANGGAYPYKNSVTHDVPHRTATQDWVLWDLEIIEVLTPKTGSMPSTSPLQQHRPPPRSVTMASEDDSMSAPSESMSSEGGSWRSLHRRHSQPRPPRDHEEEVISSSPPPSPPRHLTNLPNGRMINYHIADDDGNVDGSFEGNSFIFEGSTLEELRLKLEEETSIDGLILCTQSVISEKLYPLRLHLPPNNAPMNVVVVSPSSKLADSFGHE